MNTNFALLTNEQKTVWSMDLWKHARNYAFVNKFLGKDSNSLIQHITELKKSEKGARAVITLLADLEGDGVAGDRTLEGNEEAMKSYDQVIRIDQLAFLSMSGVSYAMRNNGIARVGSDLPFLEFAPDISAPTSQRKLRWDGTAKSLVQNGATNTLVAADTPSWELFVQLKAYAKDQYMRGIKGNGGEEVFHAFLTPQAMARLKLDPTYMANVRSARQRSADNPLFSGNAVEIDGIVFHEFRHVYNTSGAASGNKWGADGKQDGCQILFCGAQALAMADIGTPEWVEKGFDYENQQGISVSKILGFLKPQFNSIYSGNTVQDFGVISVYAAQ